MSDTPIAEHGAAESFYDDDIVRKQNQFLAFLKRFVRSLRGVVGALVLILLIFAAIFADVITVYDPIKQNLPNRLQPPSSAHIFGTDELGRDILTRVIYGTRISLSVGLVSVIISGIIGCTLGAIAGYYGGVIGNVILRVVDILMAIPNVLLNISIVAALGPGLQNVMIAVAIASIPGYCRIMRASILTLMDQEFIQASIAAGANDFHVIVSHILPNSLASLIVQATLRIGTAILSCASLSFIGIGIVPPTPEWGAMLSSGRDFLRNAPHVTAFPGMAIMLAVFAMNLLGDGLRDALDPKLKT